jgi:hypothetical protein
MRQAYRAPHRETRSSKFQGHAAARGDVYVVTTFVLYGFDEAGRFSRIRPAM